ncbi:MAG: outer membrane lipoprotein-sorting protein [Candidatus Acidiferrales bacterium]
MPPRLSLRFVLMSAVFALFVPLRAAPNPQAPPDAAAIMRGVYQQNTSKDMTLKATLDVYDKQGQMLRKKFVLLRIGSLGDSKTLVRFTDPKEVRGVELLSINQRGANDRQWIYIPATDRVRSVATRERSERFVGSDLTYEDIAEDPLDDFTYRLLSDNELIDGRKTYKIEATPVAPDRSQYKFIYYWVLQDVPCIIHAEMYDMDGHEVRTLHGSQLKKESGISGFRHIEVASVADGTHTVFTIDEAHFNTGLSPDLFTPDALGKPLPANLGSAPTPDR